MEPQNNNSIILGAAAEEPAGGCHIFCGEHAASGVMLQICVRYALRAPVDLLDFGNRCDMYYAAKELRTLTRDPASAMCNIYLRRAFTVYQAQLLVRQAAQRAETAPLLILDLLAPFMDESVNTKDSERLFENILYHLSLAARSRPVFLGVKPVPRIAEKRAFLFERVRRVSADFRLVSAEPADVLPAAEPVQPALFA